MNKGLTAAKTVEILSLLDRGVPNRAAARIAGVAVNDVDRIARLNEAERAARAKFERRLVVTVWIVSIVICAGVIALVLTR